MSWKKGEFKAAMDSLQHDIEARRKGEEMTTKKEFRKDDDYREYLKNHLSLPKQKR